MKLTLGRVLLGFALVLGLVAAPAVVAEAAASTTVSIQLATTAGKAWPVAGVIVEASSGKYYRQVETNSKGIATFTRVPGTAKITVKSLTYYSIYPYASTKKTFWPWKGHKKTVSLVVPLGAAVSGTVLTPTGPLVGGQVAAVSKTGAVMQTAVTNADGKYRLRGLATGTYAIQFNSRSWADSKNPLVADAAWSYWGVTGATWETAKKITVHQQGRKTGASVKSSVNGVVAAGSALTMGLADPSSGGQLNIERFAGTKRIAAESVYSPLYAPGTSDVVRLIPGTYRLGVQYPTADGFALYYYTGNGIALSADPADAVLVAVGRVGTSITLGMRPAAVPPTPTPTATPTVTPTTTPTVTPTVTPTPTVSPTPTLAPSLG